MVKKKILVVDDEEDVARALKIRLKANGYHVVLASDSVQAFSMANKEKPNLIILDIMIPGGGGFVVAERLKQSTATHDIPIIFLTGISGGEERAYKVGASGYLMKPYHPEKLLETIHNALEINGRQPGQTVSDMMGVTF
ncbi:MAG: response regulator [Deltaproteobacteria bacterium CG03_land_8_20_14_0_80_45_14]|nr:MAG: response regulator [Deltaproteobacteria bacterium CG03_land_8_20_14_0_80_45_14]